MVIRTYSVHITMGKFPRIFSMKIDHRSAQVADFMLRKTYSGNPGHLFCLKYNIYLEKLFVVTSSLYGNVTTARFRVTQL